MNDLYLGLISIAIFIICFYIMHKAGSDSISRMYGSNDNKGEEK